MYESCVNSKITLTFNMALSQAESAGTLQLRFKVKSNFESQKI